jgi:hypothetical protein
VPRTAQRHVFPVLHHPNGAQDLKFHRGSNYSTRLVHPSATGAHAWAELHSSASRA